MAEPQVAPPVTYYGQLVEPGDNAPPEGVPFDPAANFDQDVQSDLKVLKRGEKLTVLNTGEALTEDQIEHHKAVLAQKVEAMGMIQPVVILGDPFDEALRAKIEADREARRAAGTSIPATPAGPA